MTLLYPPSLLAAAAYSLASYTVSRLLWVRLWDPSVLNGGSGLVLVHFLCDVALVSDSQMSYAPSRAIPWPTSAPASLTSTGSTSGLNVTPTRPSGRSTEARGEPASVGPQEPRSRGVLPDLHPGPPVFMVALLCVCRYSQVSSITPPPALPFTPPTSGSGLA